MSVREVLREDVLYPSSDGKPMAETDAHRDWMFRVIELLKYFFKGQRVYVSGNLLIYYVEGSPDRSVAPDVFAVLDCNPRRRRIYKIWEEGKSPDFVLETTSRKTRREDLGKKKRIYAKLRVGEYFLYDPLGEWLKPALQGFRLVNGKYVRITPDENGRLVSKLGIAFALDNGELVVFDAATGERLKPAEERAAEMQSKMAKLEQELKRLRKGQRRGNGRANDA